MVGVSLGFLCLLALVPTSGEPSKAEQGASAQMCVRDPECSKQDVDLLKGGGSLKAGFEMSR